MSVRWTLDDETSNALLKLPETGMGFQFVEGQSGHKRLRLLVFNAEIAFDITDVILSESDDAASVLNNGMLIMSAVNSASEMQGTVSVTGCTVAPPRVGSTGGRAATTTSGPPSTGAPPSSLVTSYSLTANRVFHRFSAFNPDKRVNAAGDFAAGTYATTDSDQPFVPSGFAAVGRYALPNVLPASHHYVIEAPSGTPVTFGTVAPAYGQAGGGVEALFVNKVANAQSPPTYSKLNDE